MYENLTSLWRKVEHYSLIIQGGDQYLMLMLLVVIYSARESSVILICHAISVHFIIFIITVEHFQILIEYTWCYLNICEGLGCAFPEAKSLLPKRHFYGRASLGAPTSNRCLSVHCTLSF